MDKKTKKVIEKLQSAYAEVVEELDLDVSDIFGINIEIAEQLFCESAQHLLKSEHEKLFKNFKKSCEKRLGKK